MSKLLTLVLPILLMTSLVAPSLYSDELPANGGAGLAMASPMGDIPLNNSDYSRDNEVRSPMQYAAQLSQSLECNDKNCETWFLEDLKAHFSDAIEDFYKIYLIKDNLESDLEESALNKLKGFRVLEEMLRNAHYDSAANYISQRLKSPTTSICVGLEKNEEGYIEECYDQRLPECKYKCMNKSIFELVSSIENTVNRTAFLDALAENNSEVLEATQGACGTEVQDTLPIKTKTANETATTTSNKLCGILTSKLVLRGISGKSTYFAGNEQNVGSEYSCKGVRLAVDKSDGLWGPDPDRPMLNYVIYQNGTIYRLQEEDYLALQTAAAAYEQTQKTLINEDDPVALSKKRKKIILNHTLTKYRNKKVNKVLDYSPPAHIFSSTVSGNQ